MKNEALAIKVFTQAMRLYAETTFAECLPILLGLMTLESGQFSSDLATEHNNCAGLKYRTELSHIAKPAKYTDWESETDAYCDFEDIDDFLMGLLLFLERWPYKGQEKLKHKPVEWLEFIIRKGFCASMPDVKRGDFTSDEAYRKYLAKNYVLKVIKITQSKQFRDVANKALDIIMEAYHGI